MSLKEVAASLYAWDIADEGIERCLDNLQIRAGCNSAYLVGVMHEEKRPLYQRFYPHNPVRKYYTPEDSRVYWKPDPSKYQASRIQPLTSQRDFLKDRDWLAVLIEAARARGMRTGCELSHTIVDTTQLRERYPDTLQRNVFGDTLTPFPQLDRPTPCLNNQDVRDYLAALFVDLASNYDIDYIQTCLVLFGTGSAYSGGSVGRQPGVEWQRLLDISAGGCFCDACVARATERGLDWEAMVQATRKLAVVATSANLSAVHEGQLLAGSNMTATALLLENPLFTQWLQFRVDSVTEVFRMISGVLGGLDHKVEFRYNTYSATPELAGLDFASAFRWVDSVRESDYSDQRGTLEALETKRQKLQKIRRVLADDKPLIAALGVRPQATPEILRAAVRVAVEAGADGLSLGHYDGATMARLAAVKEGLAEAEATEESWAP